jgi:DNA-directed RNA polymerase subunit RPC12/RpoP
MAGSRRDGKCQMPIIFYCPRCGREIRVRSAAAGRMGHCAECGERIQVPDLDLKASPRTSSPNPPIGETTHDMPVLKSGFVGDGESETGR